MRTYLPTLAASAAVALAFVAAGAATQDGAPDAFARGRALYKQGKYAEALRDLDVASRALPANARLSRWSIDFQRRPVPVVLVGTRYLYFTTHCSRREKPYPPALPDSRPLLNDGKEVYDFNTVITCVDAGTGKKLW